MSVVLPPCKLIEVDLSGVEAVMLGWYAARLTGDPMVIRFAKLGIHALVTSHLVKEPVNTSLPDDELAGIFQSFKKKYKVGADGRMGPYETAKRTVHGTGFGMTPHGMVLMFPEVYRDLKHAEQVQKVYFDVCPPVPAFQFDVKKRAAKQNFLGGPVASGKTILTDVNAHPYTYQHYFWNVVTYKRLSTAQSRAVKTGRSSITAPIIQIDGQDFAMIWGEDSKRALAFYPQSTNSGALNEMEIELCDEPDGPCYIGTVYYGRTPLRAPIHDSLLLEVPFRKVDTTLERAFKAMLAPIEEMPMRPEWNMGAYLTIGVDAKIGDNWDEMEELPVPTLEALGLSNQVVGVAGDRTYFPAEELEEEDVIELGTVA
jgi:hypothetical protein